MMNRLARELEPLTANPRAALLHPVLYALRASHFNWLPAPHLLVIANLMVAAAARQPDLRRLQFSMPPRHGKSFLTSEYFPAWHLTAYPHRQFMEVSYGQDFIEGWSLKAQQHFAEMWPQVAPTECAQTGGYSVHPRHKAADWWWLPPPFTGTLSAAGVNGKITGKGFHFLNIDDPIKSQEEADSETMRDNAFEFLHGTLFTRGEPGSVISLTATRWHHDDVMQRVLDWAKDNPGAPQWYVLNLPAIAEADEEVYAPWDALTPIWARKKGEALWPERWPRDALEQLRAERHPRIWNAQYQGRPTAKGGELFKEADFRTYRSVSHGAYDHAFGGASFQLDDGRTFQEDECWNFGTCDPAGTVKTSSDYTAIGIWTVTPDNDLLLRDMIRVRLETPDQPAVIQQQIEKWRLAQMGVENKTFGTGLIQNLSRAGAPIRPLKANIDKIARALPMSLRYLHHTVFHPAERAPWLVDYEQELTQFPNGRYDDQVDVASYAAQTLDDLNKPGLYNTAQDDDDTPWPAPAVTAADIDREVAESLHRFRLGLDPDD